ncbi:MAG: hypothetical protein Q7T11_02575, partial [Deltaproteobacteria bacterium]|nr:hypothetical protein [Deltaproteobacteria bacterium]
MKKNFFMWPLSVVVFLLLLGSCGGASPSAISDTTSDTPSFPSGFRFITGSVKSSSVDPAISALKLSTADEECAADTIVCTNSEGETFPASVEDDCTFSLAVPIGEACVLSFHKEGEFVGVLMMDNSTLVEAEESGESVDLGALYIVGKIFLSPEENRACKVLTCKANLPPPTEEESSSGESDDSGGDFSEPGTPSFFDEVETDAGNCFDSGVVPVCHRVGHTNQKTLCLAAGTTALPSHLAHGDLTGECEATASDHPNNEDNPPADHDGESHDDHGTEPSEDSAENGPLCDEHKEVICHIPPGNPDNVQIICVDSNSVEIQKHLKHGDGTGEDCLRPDEGDEECDANEGEVDDTFCDPSHKIAICHIPPGNPENAQSICVDISATNESNKHFKHGDEEGYCAKATCADECPSDLPEGVESGEPFCDPSHKIAICHIPPGNPDNAHTICVDISATDRANKHFKHGDLEGECADNDVPECFEYCGDGIINGTEECDNGDLNSDAASNACRTMCILPFCGDAVQDESEECDDGGYANGDGCNAECGAEFCGDGIKQTSEACDDGNSDNTDGCTSSCLVDTCPDDPNKTSAGTCGCGIADTDSDSDGAADCNETCDSDPYKTSPEVCGCGIADANSDSDGALDCNESCDSDSNKTEPGVCGCGVADTDTDGDGAADCNESCDADPNKISAQACGCGVADTDSDSDGTADCNETCDNDPNKTSEGTCGCGIADTDTDGDGTVDCNESCDSDPNKTTAGICGCGVADTDTDGDGAADCNES